MKIIKPNLIIVEGAQGVGKGTITNMLREKIPYSTLMRLSGIEDKTKQTGLEKVYRMRSNELKFIHDCVDCETTFILDRSHITEKVYCNLGYKEYDFIYEANILNEDLNLLTDKYNVHIIVLVLSDTDKFQDRLKRDKAEVEYSRFNISNSIAQQQQYLIEILNIAEQYPDINCIVIDTSNESIDEIYDTIVKGCF